MRAEERSSPKVGPDRHPRNMGGIVAPQLTVVRDLAEGRRRYNKAVHPWSEAELAAGLARFGAPIIAVPEAAEGGPADARSLMEGLLASPNALLRVSAVPLILALTDPPQLEGRRFKLLYTAAASLRRLWRTRLRDDGISGCLPDLYSRELGLPPVEESYGRSAFAAVCESLEPEMPGAASMIENAVRQFFIVRELERAAGG